MASEIAIVAGKEQLSTHWKRLQVADLEEFKRAPLIGKWQITMIKRELEIVMRPAGKKHAAELAQILLGSYPHHAIAEPEIYSRAIVSLLAEYPAAVGSAAVDRLTRTLKFIPTRAEISTECEALIGKLRYAQFIADRTEEERSRREKEDRDRLQAEAERTAFKLKHNGKSPLDVLREKGLYSKGMEDNGKGNTGDQGQDHGRGSGEPDQHAEHE